MPSTEKTFSWILLTLLLTSLLALFCVQVSHASVDVLLNGDFELIGPRMPYQPQYWSVTWARGQVVSRSSNGSGSGFYCLYVDYARIEQTIYPRFNLTLALGLTFTGWIKPNDLPQGEFPSDQPYCGIRIRFYNQSTMELGFEIRYTWCATEEVLSMPSTIFTPVNWNEWNLLDRNVTADFYSIYGNTDCSSLALYDLEIAGYWDFFVDDFSLISHTDTYSTLTISANGKNTYPYPGAYSYLANSSVQVEAISFPGYSFDHWELDDVSAGSVNPYTILMDKDHTLKAIFVRVPFYVFIVPLNASIPAGKSITFGSSVAYEIGPCSYQWYLQGSPISEATSYVWSFTPTRRGIYDVYVKATDPENFTSQSETVHLNVTRALGDVNNDDYVDGRDLALVARAFASYPADPRWDPIADVSKDDKIDGKDMALVAKGFGKIHP